jgi:hypothetical protein
MKMIYNNILPVKGFSAINLFGVLFVRKGVAVTERMLNHERIHTVQMREMLYVFFYLWYVIEWLLKLIRHGKQSYYNISFEREAYQNDSNLEYLKKRRLFAWVKFV